MTFISPGQSYRMARGAERGINQTIPSHYESAKKNTMDIRATAEKNHCGRLSFKAAPQTLATEAAKGIGSGPIAQAVAKWKALPGILKLFNDQTLVAESFYALIVASGLRPIVNILTPAKNEDEKLKNEYRAANSIATGLLGCVFTILLAKPIGDAVEKIITSKTVDGKASKYLTHYEDQLQILGGKPFKELAKRVHQPIFMPIRAWITMAMVPPLLVAMGIKKKKNTDVTEMEIYTSRLMSFEGSPTVFQNFNGGKVNAN